MEIGNVNQRVSGGEYDQVVFKGILSRLRTGKISLNDWKLFLTRQPSVVSNINDFLSATRLFYSNDEVAKYNYEHLVKLNTPILQKSMHDIPVMMLSVLVPKICLVYTHLF
jgi:hypothetical protein